MKKILILDFDGTVVDSNYTKEKTIIEYIKKRFDVNILKIVDYFQFQKMTRYELISLVSNAPNTSEDEEEIDKEIKKVMMTVKVDPHLFSIYLLCQKLKIKIYLVSNTPNNVLVEMVESLKISHYFYKVIGKDSGSHKSLIFKRIIQDENVNPNQILSVGDNINDCFASRENIIPFHGIKNNSLNFLSSSIRSSASLIGIIKSLK